MLEARGLTKHFGDHVAVAGLDLTVPRGGCFGFLGPNGAGKTTTLRMVLGQSPITAGSLSVLGMPVAECIREIRARIGVVPQTDNQDPDFTVIENLKMYARYFGLKPRDVAGRIEELLTFLDLADRRHALIRELSGGMKRRLSIARALVNDPELIILDEPTTGLDPQVRHLIWTRLRQLTAAGRSLLLTTHYMDEAERLCDDLVVIDHGRVIARGSPSALIARHVESHVFVLEGGAGMAGLLGELPGMRVVRIGETIYAYTDDPATAESRLAGRLDIRFSRRQAGLEDVFLRLTGHGLRE